MKNKLTKSETKLFNRFMGELSDHFGNAGCNDYYLKNTAENRKLVKAAIENSDFSEQDKKDYLEDLAQYEAMDIFKTPIQKDIVTFDSLIFEYLVKKTGFKIEEPN